MTIFGEWQLIGVFRAVKPLHNFAPKTTLLESYKFIGGLSLHTYVLIINNCCSILYNKSSGYLHYVYFFFCLTAKELHFFTKWQHYLKMYLNLSPRRNLPEWGLFKRITFRIHFVRIMQIFAIFDKWQLYLKMCLNCRLRVNFTVGKCQILILLNYS